MISPPGASILITSAPRSPRICVASGPSTTVGKSRILMPASGPGLASLTVSPGTSSSPSDWSSGSRGGEVYAGNAPEQPHGPGRSPPLFRLFYQVEITCRQPSLYDVAAVQ